MDNVDNNMGIVLVGQTNGFISALKVRWVTGKGFSINRYLGIKQPSRLGWEQWQFTYG